MKNQKFNIKRFITYAKYNLTMNSRLYLTQLGSVALVIFFILFYSMLKSPSFHPYHWGISMMVSGGVSLLILISTAFPSLRKKETQMNYFMEPASILEKFTFEFVLRYIGFLILFPVLFFLIGKLVYPLVEGIRVLRGTSMVGMETLSSFNLDEFSHHAPPYTINIVVCVLLFAMSFVFAGPAVFMKNPMLKMIGFVMGLMAFVGYYFYILFEYMKAKLPVGVVYFKTCDDSRAIVLLNMVFVLLITTVLSYAFYKLKEKEV